MKPYYQDGRVTIYHGDCRDIIPSLADIDLVLTDPPYGVEWCSNRRGVATKHKIIANDDDLHWIGEVYEGLYAAMKPNSICFTFYGWPDADLFVGEWKRVGFQLKSHIVWVKSNWGLGWFTRGQHEVAYLLVKGKPKKPFSAISDVILASATGNDLHSTQKPEKLCREICNCYSNVGNLVLDPFMGSATTLLAADRLGRQAIGIEIDEKYCEIAARRFEEVSLFPVEVPLTASINETEEQDSLFAA